MQQYKVKLTLITDMLGTVPLDKDIYGTYIAGKEGAPPEAVEEIDTVLDDKGKTGFHRNAAGEPFIYDYMIRGFLKSACGMMSRVEGSQSKKLKAYKKVIDGMVFVEPRMIPIQLSGPIGELQRPLRAQTAQGERVAISVSETAPAGSTLEFTIIVLDDKTVPEELLREWFDYGKWMALGQWRSASYGRISYTLEAI